MDPNIPLISYVCKHCNKRLNSEVSMIIHVKWSHNVQLPPGLDETLFRPDVEERIMEMKRKMIDELGI